MRCLRICHWSGRHEYLYLSTIVCSRLSDTIKFFVLDYFRIIISKRPRAAYAYVFWRATTITATTIYTPWLHTAFGMEAAAKPACARIAIYCNGESRLSIEPFMWCTNNIMPCWQYYNLSLFIFIYSRQWCHWNNPMPWMWLVSRQYQRWKIPTRLLCCKLAVGNSSYPLSTQRVSQLFQGANLLQCPHFGREWFGGRTDKELSG